MMPIFPEVTPAALSCSTMYSPACAAPPTLSVAMKDAYLPELVPISAITTGVPACWATSSTAGAEAESVGEMTMMSTPAVMASWAFCSWVLWLRLES